MDLQLKNKRGLITGSSRGIGLTIALAFAHEGAQPILVARDAANLAAAEQAFAQAGLPKPSSVLLDLSVSGSAEQLFAQVPDVDILINNAGAIPGGSVVDVDEQRWRQAWELKVFGYINMTRMYLPMMQVRGHGVICNIIGMAGAAPRADYICGATGNAALMAFTQGVGGESVKHGVRVFGINPSPTRSDRMQGMLQQQAEKKLGDANRWSELTSGFPFGRLAEPSEMAKLAVFCTSPLCSYLSGSVINVDGGQMYTTPSK
jgi:NAD(P)-dependent dehydrogenase (short-subunit alcohol dehydrogenase family)